MYFDGSMTESQNDALQHAIARLDLPLQVPVQKVPGLQAPALQAPAQQALTKPLTLQTVHRCTACNIDFTSAASLKSHLNGAAVHATKKYFCTVQGCKSTAALSGVTRRDAVVTHMKTKHGDLHASDIAVVDLGNASVSRHHPLNHWACVARATANSPHPPPPPGHYYNTATGRTLPLREGSYSSLFSGTWYSDESDSEQTVVGHDDQAEASEPEGDMEIEEEHTSTDEDDGGSSTHITGQSQDGDSEMSEAQSGFSHMSEAGSEPAESCGCDKSLNQEAEIARLLAVIEQKDQVIADQARTIALQSQNDADQKRLMFEVIHQPDQKSRMIELINERMAEIRKQENVNSDGTR